MAKPAAAEPEKKEEDEEDSDELEPPRSASLPTMKWVGTAVLDPDEEPFYDISGADGGQRELTMKRDFTAEIQTYLENK